MMLVCCGVGRFFCFVFFGKHFRKNCFSPKLPLLKSLVTPALPQLNWIRSSKAAFAFRGTRRQQQERERERLVVSAALARR